MYLARVICMPLHRLGAQLTALASLCPGTARQECIFRRLINDNFVERQYNGKALLITACGFPDVQTRMLLNRLSREYPALPIYGIADLDPYGDVFLHPRERAISRRVARSRSESSSFTAFALNHPFLLLFLLLRLILLLLRQL